MEDGDGKDSGLSDYQVSLLGDKDNAAILRYVIDFQKEGHKTVYFHQMARSINIGTSNTEAAIVKLKNPVRNLLKARLLYSDMPIREIEEFLNYFDTSYKKSKFSVSVRRGNDGLSDTAYEELVHRLYSE
jgi:hypothetical protein